MQVAYFDSQDGKCTGTPLIGPIPVTVAPGDRAYVIAFGATTDALRLTSLAIPVLAGDPPLVASIPTTVARSTGPNPCSLVTSDEAAAALGAAVTDTKPDTDQGACEIKAGDASLQVRVETGNAATVFDAVRSAATAPQPVTGIGDRGFTTTDPANAIVILSGETMVAIGMSRSPTGGPADDPNQDQPILRDLVTKAISRIH